MVGDSFSPRRKRSSKPLKAHFSFKFCPKCGSIDVFGFKAYRNFGDGIAVYGYVKH